MSSANTFSAPLEIIGINPFVFLPDAILQMLFKTAGKAKSPIPVKGCINDKPFIQNLMYYKGAWRLYINTAMLKNSPKRSGETVCSFNSIRSGGKTDTNALETANRFRE